MFVVRFLNDACAFKELLLKYEKNNTGMNKQMIVFFKMNEINNNIFTHDDIFIYIIICPFINQIPIIIHPTLEFTRYWNSPDNEIHQILEFTRYWNLPDTEIHQILEYARYWNSPERYQVYSEVTFKITDTDNKLVQFSLSIVAIANNCKVEFHFLLTKCHKTLTLCDNWSCRKC